MRTSYCVTVFPHHAVLTELTSAGRELRTAYAERWRTNKFGELVPNPNYELDLLRLRQWEAYPKAWSAPRAYELRLDKTGLTDAEIAQCERDQASLQAEAEGKK